MLSLGVVMRKDALLTPKIKRLSWAKLFIRHNVEIMVLLFGTRNVSNQREFEIFVKFIYLS